MLQRKTTFILGAGASADLGFPVAGPLAKIIADKLRRTASWSLVDQCITEALIHKVISDMPEGATARADRDSAAGHYLDAAAQILEGLPLDSSIDSYMDTHRHDQRIQVCGKLSIIRCITEAEQLCIKHHDGPHGVNFEFLADKTCYGKLFKLLRERVSVEQLPRLFHNVSIISFNYDRSLEHYLAHMISTHYAITHDHAVQVVKSLTLLHPYGTVGPWHDADGHHEFGDRVDDPVKMLELSNRIQTFAERSAHADRLRQIVSESELLVFLGFGYVPENLQLLGPHPNTRSTHQIYGTTFEVSGPNTSAIESALAGFVSPSIVPRLNERPRVELSNEKCATFLDNYAMPITLGT